jgi:hypothetical protein
MYIVGKELIATPYRDGTPSYDTLRLTRLNSPDLGAWWRDHPRVERNGVTRAKGSGWIEYRKLALTWLVRARWFEGDARWKLDAR